MIVNEIQKWGDLVEDKPKYLQFWFQTRDEFLEYRNLYNSIVDTVTQMTQQYYLNPTLASRKYDELRAKGWLGRLFHPNYDAEFRLACDEYSKEYNEFNAKREKIMNTGTVIPRIVTANYVFENWAIVPEYWVTTYNRLLLQQQQVFTTDYIILAASKESKILRRIKE